jgi:hypothetical protein
MLILRNEFNDVVIARTIPGVGTITFDPNVVKPENYINFNRLGFDFIFIDVEETPSGRKNGITKKIENSKLDVIKKK